MYTILCSLFFFSQRVMVDVVSLLLYYSVFRHPQSLHTHIANVQIVQLFQSAQVVDHFADFVLVHVRCRDAVDFADKVQPSALAGSQ